MNDMSNAASLPATQARNTTTALTAQGGGIVFQTVSEARDVAYLMAGSDKAVRKHLRNNPGACFGIVIQAVEWGLSPYAVANKSYEVNDQLAYESQLIQAVILRRAPIKGRIRFAYEGEGAERVCVASATDLSGDVVEYRSPKLRDITPKNSPLWKNDPDQQLAYFSGRSLCRRHFPDVLMGIYDVDELAPMRDVTPKPSGFKDRLEGNTGGFDADGVEAAIGEAVEGAQTIAEEEPAPQHDPEFVRAGSQAFINGEARDVQDGFTEVEMAAWYYGYDQMAEVSRPS